MQVKLASDFGQIGELTTRKIELVSRLAEKLHELTIVEFQAMATQLQSPIRTVCRKSKRAAVR